MTSTETITSLQNSKVKAIRALEMRKARRESGLFVAEGQSILFSARELGWAAEKLVYLKGSAETGVASDLVAWAARAGAECLEVSRAVLGKLAAKDNPQSMLGVFKQRWAEQPDTSLARPDDVWLVLEDVRDPGNLGTMMRTVHGVGARGVILVGNCCDPYSRECVRATMGSVFVVPLVRMTADSFLGWAADWPGDILGLHLRGAEDFRSAKTRGPLLICMGREGPGLSDEMSAVCTKLAKIPMAAGIDSFNVSIAAALILYHVRGHKLTV